MKRFLSILLIIALLFGGAYWYLFENGSGNLLNSYALIPSDAVAVTEIDDPIDEWQNFSQSKIWTYLRTNPNLAKVDAQMLEVEKLLEGKEELLKRIFTGNTLMSVHADPKSSHKVLYLVDLKKAGKIGLFGGVLKTVLQNAGYNIKEQTYQGQAIYQIFDKNGKASFLCFYQNVLLSSEHLSLIQAAIDTQAKGFFAQDSIFLDIKAQTPKDGLANLYLNYQELPKLVAQYSRPVPDNIQMIAKMLDFSGMNVEMTDDYVFLDGKSTLDSDTSYLHGLLTVGKGNISAHNILPPNTSFYFSLTFDDFEQLQTVFEQMQKGRQAKEEGGLEDVIREQLEAEITQWVDKEIALAMVPETKGSPDQAYLAIIPTGSKRTEVKQKLESMVKLFDQLNPMNWFGNQKKNVYKNYRIVDLPIQGALQSLGGNMFKDLEKPQLVLIDEFLVIGDEESVLRQIIDAFTSKQTLAKQGDYQAFFQHFKPKSNVYTYLQTKELYPFMLQKISAKQKESFEQNKPYILSFPHIGFQLLPQNNGYQTYLHANFKEF